jgi:hypothetical protein
MRLRRVLCVVVAAMISVAALLARPPAATSASGVRVSAVTSGSRVITVDSAAYTVKGYFYDPVAIGDQWLARTWSIDEPTCRMDAALMKGAGVNTIRLPYESTAPAHQAQYRACLDDFAAAGIGVLWLIQAPNGAQQGFQDTAQNTNAWATAYEQWIQTAIDAWATHPATLFWTIGNEYSHQCDDGSDCWYGTSSRVGVLDRLVQYAKAHDPNHIVGTSLTSGAWQLASANLPHLDFWAINSYWEVYSPTDPAGGPDYFTQLSNADPRPKMFSEWGADRYWCTPGLLTAANVTYSCETRTAPISGEDQAMQRDRMAAMWDNIAAHLATASNPNGAVSGGTAFMLADNWSYSVSTFTPSSPATHDVAGKLSYYQLLGNSYYAASEPDNWENAEWWGATTAAWHGQNFPRASTLAFDALASRWSATAPPAMSGLSVAMSGCTPTITWTTTEAATTEVQDAQEAVVLNGSGEMLQDNSIYLLAWNDQNLSTTHSATLTARPVNGAFLRLVPRSFTADGRSVTAAPIRVTC